MTVEEVALRVLASLPDEIREEAAGVRVHVLPRPTEELLEWGVSLATPAAYVQMGEEPFFDGDDEQDRVIYLFTENIHPLNSRRIQALVMHELGHVLGMDEDEVKAAVEDGGT